MCAAAASVDHRSPVTQDLCSASYSEGDVKFEGVLFSLTTGATLCIHSCLPPTWS